MALNFLLKRSGTADKRPDPASMAFGELDLNYDDVAGGVFYKNASGDAVKVGPAQVSAGAPNGTPVGSAGNSVGEFWYDTGTSELKIFDGSSWVETGANYIPASSFTATGDLLVGTGSGTYVALPVGTDGQALVVDSTCTEGVKWGASLEGYTCTATPFNTALGAQAGDSISSGTSNVSIGFSAGTAITTGVANVAIGRSALQSATGSTGNVAVGYQALTNATASQTTAVGYNALASLSTGLRNTAFGFYAGGSVTTGNDNTFIGFGASDTATGSCNTAVGSNALGSLTAGVGNTAIGACSLDVTTGSNNTGVGVNSGASLTTGVRNVFVGYRAGALVTTGVENTIIGSYEGNQTISCSVVLANGNGDVKFQANNSGAWSPNGTSYGNAGQILSSNGSAAVPSWTSALPQVTAPTASTDAGIEGQIASDATYFYMYTGGRWQRVAWDATAW
jgi:hypothetical protein